MSHMKNFVFLFGVHFADSERQCVDAELCMLFPDGIICGEGAMLRCHLSLFIFIMCMGRKPTAHETHRFFFDALTQISRLS